MEGIAILTSTVNWGNLDDLLFEQAVLQMESEKAHGEFATIPFGTAEYEALISRSIALNARLVNVNWEINEVRKSADVANLKQSGGAPAFRKVLNYLFSPLLLVFLLASAVSGLPNGVREKVRQYRETASPSAMIHHAFFLLGVVLIIHISLFGS